MAFTLDQMSIYGQDTRILESWYKSQEPPALEPIPSHQQPPKTTSSKKYTFFSLPPELRNQIYTYILPKTIDHDSKGIVWLRGNTSILATNHQVHNEACPYLYSANTFTLDVVYDCTTFCYQWLSPSGLVPKRRLAFPEQLGEKYVKLIRRVNLFVQHVDQYTGMIKYNYGGSGLTDGLRGQVGDLVRALGRVEVIRVLRVVFQDDTERKGVGELVLEPLMELENVWSGEVRGDIGEEFRARLWKRLNRDDGT